jgi:hypothetical protein
MCGANHLNGLQCCVLTAGYVAAAMRTREERTAQKRRGKETIG